MATETAVIELDLATLESLLEIVATKAGPEVAEPFRAVVHSYAEILELVRNGKISIEKLRRILFGPKTERTSTVVGAAAEPGGDAKADATSQERVAGGEAKSQTRKPRKRGEAHGRHGAKDYAGCARVKVEHESLQHGEGCPHCPGTVYQLKTGATLVRLTGQPPITGTVFVMEQLRCNLCLEVFTAQRPEAAGEEKYDSKAAAMMAYLRYGLGMAGNRLANLQKQAQIPLPSSTQWKVLEDRAKRLEPVLAYLIQDAAQASVVYHDDTNSRVIALMEKERRRVALGGEDDPDRSGIFTTGIVAEREGHSIALYITGAQHAGENLVDLLKRRARELPRPIQMCDPLSRNMPKTLETILANCLVHGRRQFVYIADAFPQEARQVLESLKQVYQVDAEAKKRQLSADERLRLHQEQSGPVMESLHQWLTEQLEGKKVEPNSGAGKAVAYMLRHWQALTLFLRMPGAPLDNNRCEQALKISLRHRKNSLFYKTLHGAHVGDLYMSLIQTCLLGHADPFDYLTQVLEHHEEAARNPQAWMPWNYRKPSVVKPAPAEPPAAPAPFAEASPYPVDTLEAIPPPSRGTSGDCRPPREATPNIPPSVTNLTPNNHPVASEPPTAGPLP